MRNFFTKKPLITNEILKASSFATSESKLEVYEYLVGEKNMNKNLFGTILGFKKGNSQFSFFVYYSHETGRIERFLYNSSDKEDIRKIWIGKISNMIDHDKIENNNISNVNSDIENLYDILEEYKDYFYGGLLRNYPISYLNFKYLNEGKLNKQFYDMFTIELVRDYFFTFSSFHLTDMEMIKYFSQPLLEDSSTTDIGCGNINEEYLDRVINYHLEQNGNISKTFLVNYYKKLFGMFSATKFIEYNKYYYDYYGKIDNKLRINVPSNFNWEKTNYIFKGRGLECINIPSNSQPSSIKELKKYINSNTVTSRTDLINKIIAFNDLSYQKLMNIYTNYNYNPSMITDDKDFLIRK
uniref:Uncharacterized protein n=1 Tax=Coniophora puteana TaxID=80637 RepID=A0A896Z1Z1_9AGAM